MVKAKQKMKIEVNREALQRAVVVADWRSRMQDTKAPDQVRVDPLRILESAFVQRKNVNGISASGSPRRNIASGPRISAQRFDLAAASGWRAATALHRHPSRPTR